MSSLLQHGLKFDMDNCTVGIDEDRFSIAVESLNDFSELWRHPVLNNPLEGINHKTGVIEDERGTIKFMGEVNAARKKLFLKEKRFSL